MSRKIAREIAREIVMKNIYKLEINDEWEEDLEKIDENSELLEYYKEKLENNRTIVQEEPEKESEEEMEENEEILEYKELKYINNICSGIKDKLDEIDKIIEENLNYWKISRLSKIDLSIIRIAVYEILFLKDKNIPYKVSINEAVRLGKKFGTQYSSKFINGVLGGIIRKIGV